MKINTNINFRFLILIIISLTGCDKSVTASKGPPPVPVTVQKAIAKSMPVEITAFGTVEAYNSLSIMPQVPGRILKIHFKEGQYVKKGELLITIDPEPYNEKLTQAEAVLAKDKANLTYAKEEAQRYTFLLEKGAVSRSEYDKNTSGYRAQEELVKSDEALVKQAKLNLNYCSVRSPIEGKTGGLILKEGSVVEENKTKVVTINQIHPILARFSVPEKYLNEIKRYSDNGSLKVLAYPPKYENTPHEGKLTFISNSVDQSSGMIELKAEYENKDGFLWPGQFVNVIVYLTIQPNAVVVPSSCVQAGLKGNYAFVVKPDMTAELRNVVVDRVQRDETVIASGIAPGDTVVTDGQIKLKNGLTVKINEMPTEGPLQSPQPNKL
ncbi:MAG: efflux RND transporter periplasmic adaptor subunit [Nitrospirae bacterium]|nr:efflux RND transporter periplasmic adaptor subunit [Nitrospirota bacterium]MBF0534992.1 efflux RND transporter periplasmic adaptor subunit [Nitrospirota bacterium]MBF0617156.1 efflux RND transporter periplasmic adaptor subunit [Nitrospirota bacterium]